MDKKKEKMLERLRAIKTVEEENLRIVGREDIHIDNIEYCGDAVFLDRQTNEEQSISIYAVEEGNTTKFYAENTVIAYKGTDFKQFVMNPLEMPPEEYEAIKDVIEKYIEMLQEKDNPNLDKEKKDQYDKEKEEKLIGTSLKELEEEEKEELKEKEEPKQTHEEDTQNLPEFITDTSGAVDLNLMIQGKQLRTYMNLDSNFVAIKSIKWEDAKKFFASDPTVIEYSDRRDFLIAIKDDRTCEILGKDIIEPDMQEGNNSTDIDTKVGEKGNIREGISNRTSYKLNNSKIHNLHLSISNGKVHETNTQISLSIRGSIGNQDGSKEMEFVLPREGIDYYIDPDHRKELKYGHEGEKGGVEVGNNLVSEYDKSRGASKSVEDIDYNNINDEIDWSKREIQYEGDTTYKDSKDNKDIVTFGDLAQKLKMTPEQVHYMFCDERFKDSSPLVRVKTLIEERERKLEQNRDKEDDNVRYLGDRATSKL